MVSIFSKHPWSPIRSSQSFPQGLVGNATADPQRHKGGTGVAMVRVVVAIMVATMVAIMAIMVECLGVVMPTGLVWPGRASNKKGEDDAPGNERGTSRWFPLSHVLLVDLVGVNTAKMLIFFGEHSGRLNKRMLGKLRNEKIWEGKTARRVKYQPSPSTVTRISHTLAMPPFQEVKYSLIKASRDYKPPLSSIVPEYGPICGVVPFLFSTKNRHQRTGGIILDGKLHPSGITLYSVNAGCNGNSMSSNQLHRDPTEPTPTTYHYRGPWIQRQPHHLWGVEESWNSWNQQNKQPLGRELARVVWGSRYFDGCFQK